MVTIRMTARRMATTGQITLLVACLSESVPGIADITGAAFMAVRDGDTDAATMAVRVMAPTGADTIRVLDTVADIVGATREAATVAMLAADITDTQAVGITAAVATMVAVVSMAVADFTVGVAAGSCSL